MDEELLVNLRDCGCYEVGYGVESGVQRSLDMMRKDQKLEDVERTMGLTRKVGIRTKCFMIIGFPWETRADVDETIRFSFNLKPDILALSIAIPYPGAPWFDEHAHRFEDLDQYRGINNLSSINSISEHLSAGDLQKIRDRAELRYYFNPAYAWRLMRRIRTWEELWHTIKGFIDIFLRS